MATLESMKAKGLCPYCGEKYIGSPKCKFLKFINPSSQIEE